MRQPPLLQTQPPAPTRQPPTYETAAATFLTQPPPRETAARQSRHEAVESRQPRDSRDMKQPPHLRDSRDSRRRQTGAISDSCRDISPHSRRTYETAARQPRHETAAAPRGRRIETAAATRERLMREPPHLRDSRPHLRGRRVDTAAAPPNTAARTYETAAAPTRQPPQLSDSQHIISRQHISPHSRHISPHSRRRHLQRAKPTRPTTCPATHLHDHAPKRPRT